MVYYLGMDRHIPKPAPEQASCMLYAVGLLWGRLRDVSVHPGGPSPLAVPPLSLCKSPMLPASLQEGGEGQQGGVILCYGDSSVHCRMSSSTLNLYN